MINNKATLTEIARVFGVSTVTVSNALNKRKNVSPDKAEVICQYAKNIGYQPSLLAKSLLKGQTNIIGLVLKGSPEDPWYSAILNRMQEKLWNRGYFLSMFVASDGTKRLKDAVEFFAQLKVDALIIGPLGFAEEYMAIHSLLNLFPFAVAFDTVEHLPIDNVKPDTYAAAQLAVEHFVKNGHKKIGSLGYHPKEQALLDLKTRHTGFLDALNKFELDVCPDWIMPRSENNSLDVQSLEKLIDKGNLPTAFYCHTDNIAVHAVKIFVERGIRIPDEISVIGTNNLPVSEVVYPGITTISFNLDSYVDHIIQLLMENIPNKRKPEHGEKNIRRYVEQPALVLRNSVTNLNAII